MMRKKELATAVTVLALAGGAAGAVIKYAGGSPEHSTIQPRQQRADQCNPEAELRRILSYWRRNKAFWHRELVPKVSLDKGELDVYRKGNFDDRYIINALILCKGLKYLAGRDLEGGLDVLPVTAASYGVTHYNHNGGGEEYSTKPLKYGRVVRLLIHPRNDWGFADNQGHDIGRVPN